MRPEAKYGSSNVPAASPGRVWPSTIRSPILPTRPPFSLGRRWPRRVLIGLLRLIALIVLVVWVVTNLTHPGRAAIHDPSRPTPYEILSERFARGEITAQEFEGVRKVLGPER
jgi:hypothetical protein